MNLERRLKREITLADGRRITAEVEVGYTNKGALTTEDQKTCYALIKQWEDTGRRGDRPVFFPQRPVEDAAQEVGE